ncbi:MAG TPA: DciA family protein [Planctomycetota bacterium]|nr:DciA family protein [Planctomycetota bacterium]
MALPPPGPERDRDVARRPRNRARRPAAVGDVVEALVGGEAAARMRRFTKVAGVLNRFFDERVRARLRPVALAGGVLTLEIADGTLMSELRQHRDHELQAALVAAGTGVSRVVWRVARSARPH